MWDSKLNANKSVPLIVAVMSAWKKLAKCWMARSMAIVLNKKEIFLHQEKPYVFPIMTAKEIWNALDCHFIFVWIV